MRRPLDRLASEPYDLLIIGGGVNGLAAAWDAALRGLKVALVEKGDYGAATSSASLKIIHGGLRYLQHADFRRMREGIRERRALLRIAPNLVEPFPFLVPTTGLSTKSKPAMAIAMAINDLISRDRNQGVPAHNHIPRGRTLSRDECLTLAPGLPTDGLTGGALFCDGRMHNSERVTLAFGISADRQGADLANYVEVISLNRNQPGNGNGDRIVSATCRDRQTGATFDIRARQFANLTGPWLAPVLRNVFDGGFPEPDAYSVGLQLLAPLVTEKGTGLAVTSHYVDPDAKVQRGGRHYFTTPWRGQTIWGTTDRLHTGPPETFEITAAEVDEFIADINHALPSAELTPDQVTNVYGGLRPVEGKNLHTGSQVSRHSELYDHETQGVHNLISLQGVKYTACRLSAECCVDRVLQKLGTTARACETSTRPLADTTAAPPPTDDPLALHLHQTHGTRAADILDASESDRASLTEGTLVSRAEIKAVLSESVFHLADVVFRRTELCTAGDPGEAALHAAAETVAAVLNWTPEKTRDEIAAVQRHLRVRNPYQR